MTLTAVVAPVITAVVASIIPSVVATVMPVIAPVIPTLIAPAVVVVVVAVVGHVVVAVPVVTHEVDRLAAGAVAVAVLLPVALMAGRHAQVDGRHPGRAALHPDGLRIDQARGRGIAQVDATVETGLADADGHANVVGVGAEGR